MAKDKDDTSKVRILEVATKLFAQQGFDGTSIRQICKEANANVCMISYYWSGKQELYQGIIDDLIERQTQYAKTFLNLEQDFSKMPKSEQIEHLFLILNKLSQFFYSGNVSKDLIILLLKEQQKTAFMEKSPAFNYLRRLIAAVFNKNIDDKEIIFKTVFIIAQVNSPRIFSGFTLNQFQQEDFSKSDIEIIKNNVKFYVQKLLQEAKIV